MKNTTDVTECFHGKTFSSQRFRLRLLLVAAFILLLLDAAQNMAFAGSATWNLNPADPLWNSAPNWTPATVPNGDSDIATFDVSNTTGVVLSRLYNGGRDRVQRRCQCLHG